MEIVLEKSIIARAGKKPGFLEKVYRFLGF